MLEGGLTGVLLAGGKARRLGGGDKGLLSVAGQPLVQWTLNRLRPQVDTLCINANRYLEEYARFGYPVIADNIADFAGPLAGIHAGMVFADSQWILSVPCDSPFFPDDLASRMSAVVCRDSSIDIAVAMAANRVQPVFLLAKCLLADSIVDFFNAGGDGKIDRWYQPLNVVTVPFEEASAFSNINTPTDVTVAAKRLANG